MATMSPRGHRNKIYQGIVHAETFDPALTQKQIGGQVLHDFTCQIERHRQQKLHVVYGWKCSSSAA